MCIYIFENHMSNMTKAGLKRDGTEGSRKVMSHRLHPRFPCTWQVEMIRFLTPTVDACRYINKKKNTDIKQKRSMKLIVVMSQGDKSAPWSGQSWTGERPSPRFFSPLFQDKSDSGGGEGYSGEGMGGQRVCSKGNPPALPRPPPGSTWTRQGLALSVFKKRKKKVWAFRSTTQDMGSPRL